MGHATFTSVLQRRWRTVAAGLCVAMIAAGTVACAPPTNPNPDNIANMTDTVVEQKLADVAADVQATYADPAVLAEVPEENRADVQDIVSKLGTAAGRAQLVDRLRAEATNQKGGFVTGKDNIAGGILDTVVGLSDGVREDTTVHGTRSPAPPTVGASVPFESLSGNCNAPGGPGNLPAPDALVPGTLLSPQHDVYARFFPGRFDPTQVTFFPPVLAPAGVPTIGGTSGVEFRRSDSGFEMHVQVDVQDVNKDFPVAALYPLFHVRPIGATADQETQVQPVSGNIYCYSNDGENSQRGYFDGWIAVSSAEPGFQLVTEIVENDWFFRLGGPRFDLALSQPGPQFFTAGDRSTVHIGNAPITDASPIDHSVGAFASAFADPGAGQPNVLTDQNGIASDDLESTLAGMLEGKVAGGLSDALSGFISTNYGAYVIVGNPAERPTANVDLRYVDPHTAFPEVTDEPVGKSGALEAGISGHADADIAMIALGTPCTGITLSVDFESTADVWGDSVGNSTGVTPRFKVKTTPHIDTHMPWYDWPLAMCVIGYGILKWKAPGKVTGGVEDALNGALGKDGSITKILQGFDLNDFLPDLVIDPISIGNSTTGGAVMKPYVTNIDNAWCRAPGAPAGCSVDQDLLGTNGVEVAADATVRTTLAQALGQPLGGRFPNVFTPSVSSSLDALVSSHKDSFGTFAGLGVVLDPSLVNLGLRALAQGPANGTTTNGLIDIRNLDLPISGFSITTRPEVAPIVISNSTGFSSGAGAPPSNPTVRAAAPDVRLDLRTSANVEASPIHYSVSATVNASAAYDPPTGKLKPVLDSPIIDIQTIGGCQVDYGGGYALSYFFCGRGAGGNGGSNITSLNDVLDEVANAIVAPVVNDTVGSIGLPSLDGVLPGVHLTLTNVRFAQRGGFVAAYADLRQAPLLNLVGSSAGYGGEDDTIRFFAVPTNLDIVHTPTTYHWSVTDGVSGNPVAFGYVAGTGQTAVQFPSSAFATNNDTDKRKTAIGELVLDQPGLHVVGHGTYNWTPPIVMPPPNCPPGPGSFLKALKPLPGGVGGFGTIATQGCI